MASKGRREIVQDDAIRPSSTRRTSAQHSQRKHKRDPRTLKSFTAIDLPPDDKPSDLEALRKARLEYINTPADERKKKKMKYIGETIRREPARIADVQHVRKVSESKRRRKTTEPERKHRQRKIRVAESEASEYQSVYKRRDSEQDIKPGDAEMVEKETDGVSRSDGQAEEPSDTVRRTEARRSKPGSGRRPTGQDDTVGKERQTSRRRQSEPTERVRHVRRNSYGIDELQPAPTDR
jgi:hypothetical protein